MLDLILKDISDKYIRENFFRIRKFIANQVIFDGDFKLFDVTIPKADTNFPISHGLTFIPADIISLLTEGNFNYYFKYANFDKDNIYVNASGPVRIRFLAGKLGNQIGSTGSVTTNPPPTIPPGPASPGFVYGAVGSQHPGFWLTSEGIPSNVVGVPVLFADAEVTEAAVGTQTEANYTVAIYQHEGSGINLTQIGSFSVTSGGPKRFSLAIPVTSVNPNVQLACRLLTGSTLNLKVSLVLKGTTV